MPEKQNNRILERLLEGRDEGGKFLGRKEQVDRLRGVVEKLTKEQDKLRKQSEQASASVAKSLKKENLLLRGKERLFRQISKSQNEQIKTIKRAAREQTKHLNREHKMLRKNLRLETRLNRIRMQLARSRGRGSSAIGFGGLGIGTLAGLGVGALAVSQIKRMFDTRLETFLNLGSGSTGRISRLGGSGISNSSKFDLLSGFQDQGISQFILGQSNDVQKALLDAQTRLSRQVGATTANQLLTDVSQSFGPDVIRRREFFRSVGNQGLEQSLLSYQDQHNFREFERARNALQASNDPALEARREFLAVTEQLKESFEKLVITVGSDLVPLIEKMTPAIKKVLQWLGGLSSTQVAVGAGGLVAARLAGGSLVRGGGRLAARGIGAGIPQVGAGISALPGIAASGGIAAGATLAAPVAIGGGIAYNASEKANKSLRDALSASEKASRGIGRLDQLALSLRQNARTKRENLVAQRLTTDRLITGIEPGLTGEYTPAQQRQLSRLREQRRNIQSDIDVLDDRREAEKAATQATKEQTKAVEKATSISKQEIRSDSLQSRILRREELQLPRAVSQTLAALQREELATARISPFGGRLALAEISKLNESLTEEQSILREILATIDVDDERGRLEANRIRTEIAGLGREIKTNTIALKSAPLQVSQAETDLRRTQLELARTTPLGTIGALPELQSLNDSIAREIEILQSMAEHQELTYMEQLRLNQQISSRELQIKQNNRAFIDALKDGAISQVLGAGAGHRSIVISSDRALGIGLRKGVIGFNPGNIFGNVDPKVQARQPITAQQLIGRITPFTSVGRIMRGHLGSNAGESLKNAGDLLIKIGKQLNQEQLEQNNQIKTPVTSYAPNRLSGVTSTTP